MIAAVPPKRRDSSSSFTQLARYLSHATDLETGEVLERGHVMVSDALLSADTAAIEMKATASESTRCKDPVLHVVLSWQQDEKPTGGQWQHAVHHVMASLQDRDGRNLAEHQYMAVAHEDTENFHVHIVANRVHPETTRAVAPAWLHKTLSKACREIEAEQGWRLDPGLYGWDEGKGQAVALTHAQREQQKDGTQARRVELGLAGSGKAAQMEHHGNAESLQTYVKGSPAKDVHEALARPGAGWQDVHAALIKHGLQLHKGDRGGYTVSGAGRDGERIHVKASDALRRDFSGKAQRTATEDKLGPWEPAKAFIPHVVLEERAYSPHREPKRDPRERENLREARAKARADLKTRYAQYKAAHYRQHEQQRGPAGVRRDAEREQFRAISRAAREQRRDIHALNLTAERRKAALSIAAVQAIQAREQLCADLAEQSAQSKPKDYRSWIIERATEGDQAAIAQLRGWHHQASRNGRDARRLTQEDAATSADHDHYDPADPRQVQAKAPAALRLAWTVDTTTGDVAYQIDGQPAFTDRGSRVTFGQRQDADALEAGLQLAAEKYQGRLTLTGSDSFKRDAVRVAAARGLRVEFADRELARYHETCKQEMQVEREQEAARRRAEQNWPREERAQARPAPSRSEDQGQRRDRRERGREH